MLKLKLGSRRWGKAVVDGCTSGGDKGAVFPGLKELGWRGSPVSGINRATDDQDRTSKRTCRRGSVDVGVSCAQTPGTQKENGDQKYLEELHGV